MPKHKPGDMKAPTRKEIIQMIKDNWHPAVGEECIPLAEALGRVATEDVFAVNTLPVVRSSGMDGIAVKSERFADGKLPDTSDWEYGVDYIRADTGDDFDDAFDAVIAIEQVEMLEHGIRLQVEPGEVTPGSMVNPSGSMVQAGELVLPKGYEITPFRMAGLATAGVKEVRVCKKPVVAFLPTGSELIPAGQTPARGKNIESNSLMVKAFVESWGGVFVGMDIVKDQMTQLDSALKSALNQADIVLICGGSSKGSEDFSIPLIRENGRLLQHYAASAPGRPMSASVVQDKLVLNIPGPTMAAFAVSDWAVKSSVDYFLGKADVLKAEVDVILKNDVKSPPFMEIYTRVIVTCEDGIYYASTLTRQSRMGDGFGRCNGILVTELGRTGYQKGDHARVFLIS